MFWVEWLTTVYCPIAQFPTLTADLDSMIIWDKWRNWPLYNYNYKTKCDDQKDCIGRWRLIWPFHRWKIFIQKGSQKSFLGKKCNMPVGLFQRNGSRNQGVVSRRGEVERGKGWLWKVYWISGNTFSGWFFYVLFPKISSEFHTEHQKKKAKRESGINSLSNSLRENWNQHIVIMKSKKWWLLQIT